MKIKPLSLHKRLTANHCQELIILLRQFCFDLKKIQGKVLNNKINPANIFLLKGYRLCLAEWGYSSFREEFDIQAQIFESRKYGILRGEKEWFVSPEYLAPEIIKEIVEGKEEDFWQQKGSPDIWSLGLTIFEIITLIPLWIGSKCSITTHPSVVRQGLLYTPGRDLKKLQEKQLHLQKMIGRCLAKETNAFEYNEKL